jgi:hypothetical protein
LQIETAQLRQKELKISPHVSILSEVRVDSYSSKVLKSRGFMLIQIYQGIEHFYIRMPLLLKLYAINMGEYHIPF